MSQSFYTELFNEFLFSPKIDTHEHLLPQETYHHQEDILFAILGKSYLPWICFGARDLPDIQFTKHDVLEKLPSVVGSAFYRYLLRAFDFMYGFQGNLLNESDWGILRLKIESEYTRENTVRKWLHQTLSVQHIVWDRYWAIDEYNVDRELYSPVLRIDPYFFGYSALARDHDRNTPYRTGLEKGKEILLFDDYLTMIEQRFDRGMQEGITALKCAIAYDRGLDFPMVSKEKARLAFERKDGTEIGSEVVDFQNYIFHVFMEKAHDYRLSVQIHTGPGKAFQGAAARLGSVFERYRSLKISLMHGGFPWVGEPGAMAHFYPNLFIDMVWLPLLSPTYSDLALTQWIETTGGSRIMMGGDSWNAEGAVGSILYVMECLARVLAGCVDRHYLDYSTAREIGHMILWHNPVEFFGDRLRLP